MTKLRGSHDRRTVSTTRESCPLVHSTPRAFTATFNIYQYNQYTVYIAQTPTPIPHGGEGGRGGYTCSMQWSARACHDNNYTFCWTAIIYYIQDINAAYIKFYHCDDYFYRHHCCCWTLAAAAPRKEICVSWWLSVHVSCCNLKINTKIYIPLILEYIIKTSVNSYPF